MYGARPQLNDAGRRDIALAGLGSGAGASTGRDLRYDKGFRMGEQPVGFSRQGVLELMTADMPMVEELKKGLPKIKFLQASNTTAAHKSAMSGKDGWLEFCKQLAIPPIRIYAEAPSKEQIEFDTVLFLLYAAWKIPKMKAGKGRGAEIDSAYQYISSIKSAMNKEVGGQREVQVNQSWLKSQFDGWKRERLEAEGPRQRHRKNAFCGAHFQQLRQVPWVDWNRGFGQVWWAAAEVAFTIGLRVSEYTTESFNPRICFTLSDLQWFHKDGKTFDPRELMHRDLRDGEWCSLAANPSKTDQLLEKFAELRFPMVYEQHNLVVNACRSLAQLEKARQIWDEGTRKEAPLFLDPRTGKALSTYTFTTFFKVLLEDVFGHEVAKKFGSHSFRIGGATELKMRGRSDDEIMMWGRWSSEAYRRYVRASLQNMLSAASCLTVGTDTAHAPLEDIGRMAHKLPPLSKAEVSRMGISLTEAVAISKLNVASDGDATEGWESEDEVSLPDTFDRQAAMANSQWI